MEGVKWKALSLTHVEYPTDDIIGKLLAYISLTPFAIIVGFFTLIIFRRDLHTISFFIGTGLNEGINLILKLIIQQPRPMLREVVHVEYGMPSSHSQYMWFFSTYAILFLMFRLHHLTGSLMEFLWKSLLALGLFFTAAIVSYSRVYLYYHTWGQIIWGGCAGIMLGICWFTFTHVVLTPYFPIIASWKMCELMMIRDTSLIPNVLWFEYTHTRAENRARNRKLTSMKSQ